MDSARLLSDLDLLATAEWQTLPAEGGRDAELLAKVRQQEHGHGAAAYGIALQALWHNCPDALEVALSRVQTEVRLMAQKLEFTRIRQAFVALCREFHCGSSVWASLSEGTAALQARCAGLIELQGDDQESALPGLITKRDTILLRTRMGEVSMQLGAGVEADGRPPSLQRVEARQRRAQSMEARACSRRRPPSAPPPAGAGSPASPSEAGRPRRRSSRRACGASTTRTGRGARCAPPRPPACPAEGGKAMLDDEAFAAVYAAALQREEERRRREDLSGLSQTRSFSREDLSGVFHRVAASPEAEYGTI